MSSMQFVLSFLLSFNQLHQNLNFEILDPRPPLEFYIQLTYPLEMVNALMLYSHHLPPSPMEFEVIFASTLYTPWNLIFLTPPLEFSHVKIGTPPEISEALNRVYNFKMQCAYLTSNHLYSPFLPSMY